nr:uncharacterized protein CTRU02_00136 [Colletotrichum truncatum]KAF6801387.1 hypothetical protein CTRU02_00136 [Colletotrichum truncatum]
MGNPSRSQRTPLLLVQRCSSHAPHPRRRKANNNGVQSSRRSGQDRRRDERGPDSDKEIEAKTDGRIVYRRVEAAADKLKQPSKCNGV